MQTAGPPQPPWPPMVGYTAPQQNMGPPMPMQFMPAGPPQQPPQFMQQQFQPVGQVMPGVNMGMPGQMPHFPQPGQHLPHSGHVPAAPQAVPMAYQAARPMSEAPMQLPPQAVFPGGHMPTMGAPMQLPPQAVFPGGHMPTMGAPMPPPYTYQSTSVPPVAQPWCTAPVQGVPLVSPMVQPGHQSMPASLPPVSSTEPSSSDWQEHCSGDGKKYYYNKRTGKKSWEKPTELMTPLERADASTEWKEFTTAEGRKYYYNKVTKQSKFAIPDELKIARELAEMASNQQPGHETETTSNAPAGSASVSAAPSSLPANQSSSLVGIVASSTQDAITNLTPGAPPAASLSYNGDISSSNGSMQNDRASAAVVTPITTSMPVSSVASGAGTSRNNYESSSLTSITDTKVGACADDMEAKKTTPTAGKINVTLLENKTSEEPVVYANKLEAKNAFKSLLESANVEADWSWEHAMRVIINDKRYCALRTLGDRKQAFYEYLNQLIKIEAEERRVKHRKARYDFLKMLEESKDLTSSTRWNKAITMFKDDERFNAIEGTRERQDLFDDYLVELQEKEKAKAAEEHKRHVAEYKAFLKSCDFIKVNTQWRKVRERLEDDDRCFQLEKIDRLDVFQEYIRDLEKEEEEQMRIQKEQTRRQERKNRDEFRKMLEQHVADGTLDTTTHWREYCAQVNDSHAYLAVASNMSGSMPKELFEDVMEELDKQYQDDKILVKDVVKSGKIHMGTLEEFQAAVTEDDKCKGISNINIKLIYEDQTEWLREKELKEAKKRQRLCDNFLDLLYSIKEITATSTWDDSKSLFHDTMEYRDLGSETYARELFEGYIVRIKERLKFKERMREEEKIKKEKDREEREKKKDREKERKEKDHKEKERDREKEREKEKGKDLLKIDGMLKRDGDVELHGSKDKKREKDKEKKHKRRHYDTTDDLSSERDEKDDSKKSRRHSSDHKKSRKHTHASDSDRENRHRRHRRDRDSSSKIGVNEELEDGEFGADGEIH